MEKRFIIVKLVISQVGKKMPVVLTQGDQIWEFESYEEAEKMAEIFEVNSDSGWEYKVKEV